MMPPRAHRLPSSRHASVQSTQKLDQLARGVVCINRSKPIVGDVTSFSKSVRAIDVGVRGVQ